MQVSWEYSTINMATPKTLVILLLFLGVVSACPGGKSSFHCITSLFFGTSSQMSYAFYVCIPAFVVEPNTFKQASKIVF